jgi:hypothetical protein
VMGALGYKIFEPLVVRKQQVEATEKIDEQPLLFFKTQKADASGKRTSEGFVVMAGSTISLTTTKSCPKMSLNSEKSLPGKSMTKVN